MTPNPHGFPGSVWRQVVYPIVGGVLIAGVTAFIFWLVDRVVR